MNKKELFLYFSEKANHQVGHVLLTFKSGEQIKYTALYDSEKESEIYTWDDKVFLGKFNQEDVLNCERIKSAMWSFEDVPQMKFEKEAPLGNIDNTTTEEVKEPKIKFKINKNK